jgi:hypothetical protein
MPPSGLNLGKHLSPRRDLECVCAPPSNLKKGCPHSRCLCSHTRHLVRQVGCVGVPHLCRFVVLLSTPASMARSKGKAIPREAAPGLCV